MGLRLHEVEAMKQHDFKAALEEVIERQENEQKSASFSKGTTYDIDD